MTRPIAIQLYSVRDALARDFEGTLRRVADMGVSGVEFAGVYGDSAAHAAALTSQLGMKSPSAHLSAPYTEASFDTAAALGVNTIVYPWAPPTRFASLESIEKICQELNIAAEQASARGLRFAYHNHDAEATPLADGTLPLDHMRQLVPAMTFEVDIYWLRHAGQDPAAILKRLDAVTPLIHVKDGTGKAGDAFVAAGEGIVDIPAALDASSTAEWLIVELDACATDMFEALHKSVNYLVERSYGHLR